MAGIMMKPSYNIFGLQLMAALITSTLEACPPNCHSCIRGNICTVCSDGFYGLSCENRCSSTCKDGQCYDWNGQCKGCQDGWYGGQCDKKCRSRCKGGKCLDISGHCEDCEDDRHGHYCEKTCAPCHNYGKCDRKSGLCVSIETASLICDYCKPGCPQLCNSQADEHSSDDSNVVVYTFVAAIFLALIIASSCAVNKKRQALKAARQSANMSKTENLITNDQPSSQESNHLARHSRRPSTRHHGSNHHRKPSRRLSAKDQSSSQLGRSSPKPSTSDQGSTTVVCSSPQPSTSNDRSINCAQPLVFISEPALKAEGRQGQIDTDSVFEEVGADVTVDGPPGPPFQHESSGPRPPPPPYQALFPS